MARPKSIKPIKSKTISGRLTEENYKKIKDDYGSIQVFLDVMVEEINKPIDTRDLIEMIRQNEKDLDDRLESLLNN